MGGDLATLFIIAWKLEPWIRDGFEPDFCGLGSGRVLEMRARVGSGLTMRAAGRVGPVHSRYNLRASFSKLFLCNLINIYGFYLGVDLLPSKINSFYLKKILPKRQKYFKI